MNHPISQDKLFAGGIATWLLDSVWKVLSGIAPPWTVVPPLIFASAALLSARTAHLKALAEIEEKKAARAFRPRVESLN